MKISTLQVEFVGSVVVSTIEEVALVDSVPCASLWLPLTPLQLAWCRHYVQHWKIAWLVLLPHEWLNVIHCEFVL